MTEPKWTPGPWRFVHGDPFDHGEDAEADGFSIEMAKADSNRRKVAHYLRYAEGIFPEDGEYAEAEANAHLIAAAPDLYAQLEDARVTLGEAAKILAGSRPSFANNIVNQCGIRCGDVLAKARGESA